MARDLKFPGKAIALGARGAQTGTFLVADHSKLSRSAPARIGSLSQLDAIFTDRPLPGDLARACEGWQTRVMLP